MKFEDLKNKSEKQLHELLSQKRNELRALRFQASENQLSKVRDIRETRKVIARILTFLNKKV
ncbi:MAG: 50S ribosomal protein L29 [Candidatus Magasanikbacteria bacterium]|nr:50S ribosomal protein L29 [Candidatus Magasanikbacteria bacterium]